MKALRLFFLTALIVACGGNKNEDPAPETGIDYLNEMLDIMQAHALYKKTIDWPTVRSQVLAKANADGAKTVEDVFPAIQLALNSLNDKNSKYYASNSTVLAAQADACTGSSATVDINDANIGYVLVTHIAGESQQVNQYAVDMQTIIKNQDSEDIKGWIVDLRGLAGGNMMAMLAGVGPLLGNGVTGYFIDADDAEIQVSYNDGVVVNQGATTYVADFYTPIDPGKKVAVLIDQRTAISGEGVAIAFLGHSNTRSFGTATCGVSTAPGVFTMSDGATLALVDVGMADRNKVKIYNGLTPDVTVAGDKEVVNKAIEWINEE